MSKHVFDIPEDRPEEVAQKLANKLAVIAGLQLYHNCATDDMDLQQLIRKSNIKIQNMINSF